MLRLLLTRRWLGFTLLVIVIAAACVRLGIWQWHRGQQRAERNERIAQNLSAPAVPVTDLLSPDLPLPPSDQWRIVSASGTYRPEAAILVRNRVLSGRAGFHVLVPLQTDTGVDLLVDRGWVPRVAAASAAVEVPAPPASRVAVAGRVRISETGRLEASDTPSYSVGRIVVADLAARLAVPTYRGYVELTAEQPSLPTAPTLLPPPALSAGPHLAYAVQWEFFAGVALVGWFVLLRREASPEATGGPRPSGDSVPIPRQAVP